MSDHAAKHWDAAQPDPRKPHTQKPARAQLSGGGNPRRTLKAPIGEKYLDETSGRRWIMTEHGWELMTELALDVLRSDKGRWNYAAKEEGQRLEDWVTEHLNAAAAKHPLPFEPK